MDVARLDEKFDLELRPSGRAAACDVALQLGAQLFHLAGELRLQVIFLGRVLGEIVELGRRLG